MKIWLSKANIFAFLHILRKNQSCIDPYLLVIFDSVNNIFIRSFCSLYYRFNSADIFEAAFSVNQSRVMSSLFHGFFLIIKYGKLVNVQQILNNPHPITELLNNLLVSEDSRINFLLKEKLVPNMWIRSFTRLWALLLGHNSTY